MTKRIISLILSIVMVLSMMPVHIAASAEELGTEPPAVEVTNEGEKSLFARYAYDSGYTESSTIPLRTGYPLVFCFGTYEDHIYVTDLETTGVAMFYSQYTADDGAPAYDLGVSGIGTGAVKYTHTDGTEYTYSVEGILGDPGDLIAVYTDPSQGFNGLDVSPSIFVGQTIEVKFAVLDSATTYQMLPENVTFTTEGVATLEHVEGTVYKIGVSEEGFGQIHYTWGNQSGTLWTWGIDFGGGDVDDSVVRLFARWEDGSGFIESSEIYMDTYSPLVFCFGTYEDHIYVTDLETEGIATLSAPQTAYDGAPYFNVGVSDLSTGTVKYTHTDGTEYTYSVQGMLGYPGDMIAVCQDSTQGWNGLEFCPNLAVGETLDVEFAVLDSYTTYQMLPEGVTFTAEGVATLEHVEGTVYRIGVSGEGPGEIHYTWGNQTGTMLMYGYESGMGPAVDDTVVRLFGRFADTEDYVENPQIRLNGAYPIVFCFGTYADHIQVAELETEGVAVLEGPYTSENGESCFHLSVSDLGQGAVKYTHTDGTEYTFNLEGILGYPGELIAVRTDSSLGYNGVELTPSIAVGESVEVEFAVLDSYTTYQILPEDAVIIADGVATVEHVEGTVYRIGVSGEGFGDIYYTLGDQSGSMWVYGYAPEEEPEDTFGQEEFDAALEYKDGFWWLMEDITITDSVTFEGGTLMLLAHNSPEAKHITIAEGGRLSFAGGCTVVAQNGGSITVENRGFLRMAPYSYLNIVNNGSLTLKDGGILTAYNADVYVNSSGSLTAESGSFLNVDRVFINSGTEINGVDISMLRMANIPVNSVAELKAAMAEYAEYEGLEVYTSEDFTITENLTIPVNMVFAVGGGTTVTVAAGVTLTNHGTVLVAPEAELIHNGTMVGIGLLEIKEDGTFTNNGTVNLDPNSILAEGTCGANATWTITGDGVLTISGTGAMDRYSAGGGIASPWSPYRNFITSVVVEDGITDLGFAPFFDMVALTTVTLPEGIPSIPGFCFSRCSELSSVNIPASVTSIGETAFALCEELFNLTFLSDAPSFANNAFNLFVGNVYYPKDNATWTNEVFQAYGGMITWIKEGESTGITVGGNGGGGGGIPDWEVGSGQWGPNATYVLDENGVLTISGTGTIGRNGDLGNNIKTIVIEDGITGIGDFAFGSSHGVTSVVIADSVTSFGTEIFCYCSALTDVKLPAGMTTIPDGMFQECTNLRNIEIPATVTSILERAFRASGLESIELPDGVTFIGSEAFCVCSSLESVTLPESLTGMGGAVFAGCSALQSVEIPGNVKTIGSAAFHDCVSVTEVILPEGLISIDSAAFMNCEGLESIDIPASVEAIAGNAFAGCINLSEIVFCGDAPAIDAEAFGNVTATAYYPEIDSWTSDVMQNYGGTLDWVSYPFVPVYVTVNTVQELQDALAAGKKYITVSSDMELNEIYEFFGTTIQVENGVTLTVNNGMYINPESVLSVDGKLVSNGEINVEGQLITSGEVVNNGTLWINQGGKINIQNSATLVNNHNLHIGFGDEAKTYTSLLQVYGTVTNYGYLNVVAKGSVQVMGTVNNTMDDEKVGFMEIHGTMTVNGTLNNVSNVGIAVYGTLRVNGTYTGNSAVQMHCENGQHNVTGISRDYIVANYNNVVDLEVLLEAMAGGYKAANVSITGNIVLTDSLVIPAGSSLHVADFRTDAAVYARNIETRSTCASLTVPEGKTLTIEGSLENDGNVIISQNAELCNKEEGIIENTGSLMVEESASVVNEGSLANEGLMTIATNAALTNSGIIKVQDSGEVVVQNQGAIVNNGTVTVRDGEITVEEGGTLEGNQPFVPVASIGDTDYSTLTEALADGETGDAVILLSDTSERDVIVKGGITLDLNGHALTAEYVFAVKGSHIVDSSTDNTGILLVDPDLMMMSSTNSDLPVWTGEGFIFIDILSFQEMYSENAAGQTQYIFSPTFEPIAHQYLTQGMANSRVKIAIRMSWEIETGSAFQNFVFNDETVKAIIDSFNGSWYGRAFSATITSSKLSDFDMQVVLISDTGVELICN